MKSTKDFWEDRYSKYQNQIEGVLFKSLPTVLNLYIHKWMLGQIEKEIPANSNLQILDIGCGYGRLALPLIKKFKKAYLSGVDISQISIDLYNKNLGLRGKGYCTSITKMPFKNKTFDVVYVVTTLMYLSKKKDQEKAFDEIFRILKPGGKLIVIERNPVGYSLVTLWGVVEKIRGKVNKEIPAVSFAEEEMVELFKKSKLQIKRKSGIPFFSILFYFLYLISLINKVLSLKVLGLIQKIDNLFSLLLTPSLYISYIGLKE